MTTKVELHSAFFWTCDACGRDNFERGIAIPAEQIDADDVAAKEGADAESIREFLDGPGDGVWIAAPNRVTCAHCAAGFDVEGDGP